MPDAVPPGPAAPLLEFRDVHTYYGDLHVLKGVDYSIAAGEIVCLLGGNASGKSTLLTILALRERQSGGELEINGVDVAGMAVARLRRVRLRVAPAGRVR